MTDHFSRATTLLIEHSLSCALLQDPADLLYCTGLRISQGTLLVGKDTSRLFLDGRYYELALCKKLPCEVILLKEPNDLYVELRKVFASLSGTVGFNASTMSFATHEKIQACCEKHISLKPSLTYFSSLRRKKDHFEIQAISRACELCEKGLTFLLEEIRPGVSEKHLVSRLKTFWFEHEAQAISFEPIIAFDAHSSIPHWSSSESLLKDHGTILIDIGVQLENYHSDMTRMVFFGSKDEEIEKCFSIVKEAYEKAFSFAAPGVTPHLLDSIAREHIANKGYGKYFTHGLGHGLGLEVHESPRLSPSALHEAPLEIGDVFTIEPGIYLPGRGGVRLENTIVLEGNGPRSFFSYNLEPILLP